MMEERMAAEIAEAMRGYATARAAGPEALRIVQRRKGWVSDGDLEAVAGMLGMSSDELDGVATFYSLVFRRPVGRHVILLCDSICCYIGRYAEILAALRGRLGAGFGETTADGRFTILPAACLGACDRAPAMMIDETLHGDLTPEGLGEILDLYP